VFTPAHERFWKAARRRLGDQAGTRTLIEVLLLHRTNPGYAVTAGIDRALTVGSLDPAVIAIEARRHLDETTDTPIAPIIPLHTDRRPLPTLNAYDELLEDNQ